MEVSSKNLRQTGSCRLCGENRELAESHLIPKFVFRWIKQTGSGFLRGGENFNVRVQDGIKAHFLCDECESRLNKYETYFANRIFFPVVNKNADEFTYSEEFYRFVISVFWRLLKHSVLEEEKSVSYYDSLLALELRWRLYLLGDDPAPNEDLHLLTGVDVVEVKVGYNVAIPPRIIQYMARGIDGGITDSDTKAMLFLKLPRFLFIYQLHVFLDADFIDTRIANHGGTYHLNNAKIHDADVGDFFLSRVGMIDDLFQKMSDTQKEKLRCFSNEKWDEVAESDLGNITKYQNEKYK